MTTYDFLAMVAIIFCGKYLQQKMREMYAHNCESVERERILETRVRVAKGIPDESVILPVRFDFKKLLIPDFNSSDLP